MEPVSQNGSRKRRPWTAHDQITAEVAAACGVSIREIGRVLGRAMNLVRIHMVPADAEKKRKQSRGWYRNNRDKTIKRVLIWQNNNRDKIREIKRRYYDANHKKILERNRLWHQANPERQRQHILRYRAANPHVMRDKARRRNAFKRAARRQALQPVTRQQIYDRFALWQCCCAFCGVDATHQRNHGRQRLTVEHVLALTKGGLDEAANIIPACTACNSSKNNSPIEDWYRQQPWFMDARWRKIQRHCSAAVVGQLPLALTA